MKQIMLSFSQRTVIKLAKERADEASSIAQRTFQEFQNIIREVAMETGMKENNLKNWKLDSDLSKFTEIEKEEEKEKEKEEIKKE